MSQTRSKRASSVDPPDLESMFQPTLERLRSVCEELEATDQCVNEWNEIVQHRPNPEQIAGECIAAALSDELLRFRPAPGRGNQRTWSDQEVSALNDFLLSHPLVRKLTRAAIGPSLCFVPEAKREAAEQAFRAGVHDEILDLIANDVVEGWPGRD